jgi:FAD/FMN-containing dehydrogenase
VLASGEIVNANHTSKPDLYWALKGGSNNFGIVTRFDMSTVPSAGNWANVSTYNITIDNLDSFAENFYDSAAQEPYDEFAGFTRVLVANDGYIDFEYRVYTKEFDARDTPAPFQNMSTLSPLLQSTQGFYNVSDTVKQVGGIDNSNR